MVTLKYTDLNMKPRESVTSLKDIFCSLVLGVIACVNID